ncbi:hypothetical protein PBI_KAMPE_63 [Gordonia phage Kampe]|uniref:Uncharacterized protein n=3 Tax=Gordonia phage Orchid TaxID=1838075 RepID=A0A160DJK3_9CAUD|nr:hypothetical protein BH761_gp062 [Gordonia phage Orchid]ANA87297.1 hypothetical protein PBI_PATRICKSTAR_63 [Gordonia phage PatrickStar]ANA87409.1 hypothetical protein PBI_ORCHID_62 [Gordonia phage Orchid]ANA87524.1 hypothetical protein PBI_KAMPE_63 [Gordonia phage Kampe]
MSMELEEFSGSALVENGDRIKAKDLATRPLLVYVVDEVGPIKTQHSKSPEGEMGLILDILDLQSQDKYLSVLWMNKQVVDNLSRYIGKAVAIQMDWKKSKTGNDYLNLSQLEGEWANYAKQWVTNQPNVFVDERVTRQMKTYEEIRGSKLTGIAMNNTAANPPVSQVPATQPSAPPSAPTASAPPAAPPSAPPSAPPASAPAAPPSAPPAAAPAAPPAAPPSAPPAAVAPPSAPPAAPPAAPATAPAAADDDDMPF